MSSRTTSLAFIVLCLAALGWFLATAFLRARARPAIALDSDQLNQTVIVPTLDTAIPVGKSAIWCGSFQLAWDHLRKDVVREPIKLENAQVVADRLNKVEFDKGDLEPSSYYAEAGLVHDGIVEKIRTEMQEQYPTARLPGLILPTEQTVAVVFAYLKAEIKFRVRYDQLDKGMLFAGSDGTVKSVQAFGLEPRMKRKGETPFGQALVARYWMGTEEDFIIDLDTSSRPVQVLLARIRPWNTLQEGLDEVDGRLPVSLGHRRLLNGDKLGVPVMHWALNHRFGEVEGPEKKLWNRGFEDYWLDPAMQTIAFRLDGTEAVSATRTKLKAKKTEMLKEGPREFLFDRPFLIIIKKRDAKQPYLVMWIANAELMMKLK